MRRARQLDSRSGSRLEFTQRRRRDVGVRSRWVELIGSLGIFLGVEIGPGLSG